LQSKDDNSFLQAKPKRDVIFFTGRAWEMFAAPHRIALALAALGCKVLFCELPVSPLRNPPRPTRALGNGVCLFQPAFLSARINRLALARDLQAKAVVRQIEQASADCGLQDPVFLHAYAGDSGGVCRQMRRSYFVVHVCTDHPSGPNRRDQELLVEMSDHTLVIPESRFHQLKARFGDRISMIPQAVDFTLLTRSAGNCMPDPVIPLHVPRPRLGYLGAPFSNLNAPLLASLLKLRPDWHFVSLGSEKAAPLPNAHFVPWLAPTELAQFLRSVDVGFMPYDCYQETRLHCVPLKMFEYFAFGLPVVSTPLVHLWQYKNLIYLGDTAEELVSAVEAALKEPFDSPKRVARIEIARNHSIENLAATLRKCLPLDMVTPGMASDSVQLCHASREDETGSSLRSSSL